MQNELRDQSKVISPGEASHSPPAVQPLKKISSSTTIIIPTSEVDQVISRTLLPPPNDASSARRLTSTMRHGPSRTRAAAVSISQSPAIIIEEIIPSAPPAEETSVREVSKAATATSVLEAELLDLQASASGIAAATAAVGFFSPRPTRNSRTGLLEDSQNSVGIQAGALVPPLASVVPPAQDASTQAPVRHIERPVVPPVPLELQDPLAGREEVSVIFKNHLTNQLTSIIIYS